MRKRYEVKKNLNSTFTLNITSMTDMFTLLLVFLLQTYSTAEVNIDPSKNIRLPSSSSDREPTEGVRISLSKDELKVGEKKIASLFESQFEKDSLDEKDPQFIKPLFDELKKITQNEKNKKHIEEGKVLFQADRSLPYGILKKVMYTASMAGFPQLKLVAIVGE